MLLQKRVHFHPGLESQHLANGGFRQPFSAVAFQGQCLKRDPRRVTALESDFPGKIVRDVERDLHRIRITHVADAKSECNTKFKNPTGRVRRGGRQMGYPAVLI